MMQIVTFLEEYQIIPREKPEVAKFLKTLNRAH